MDLGKSLTYLFILAVIAILGCVVWDFGIAELIDKEVLDKRIVYTVKTRRCGPDIGELCPSGSVCTTGEAQNQFETPQMQCVVFHTPLYELIKNLN